MAGNEEFIDRLKEQIQLLQGLEDSVHGTIENAKKQVKELEAGKSIKEVFVPVPPSNKSGAQRR